VREALSDFIKNAGLFTVLHFFITTVVLLIGFAITIFARSRASRTWFPAIGMMPAFSGILTWYFESNIANHRLAMFGRLDDAGVAAVRREALIDLIVGLVVAAAVLGFGMSQRHNRRAISK
jgi:hypothetical protein